MAVSSALPFELAVREVDARENAAVETESVAIVNDQVVEEGIQVFRCPALLDGPSAGSVRNPEPARPAAVANTYQDVAILGEVWLHDGDARPGVLPQQLAVCSADAGGALRAQQ